LIGFENIPTGSVCLANQQHAALQLKVAPEYRQMAPVYQWWLDQREKAGWGPAA